MRVMNPVVSPADLSSYIPKHSVDFSAWQEHKESQVYQGDTADQQAQTSEEVMVRGNRFCFGGACHVFPYIMDGFIMMGCAFYVVDSGY